MRTFIIAAAITLACSLNAGDAVAGYDFDVRVMPYDGQFTVTIRVDTPDGPFTSVSLAKSTPDLRTITSTHGGKSFKVTVNLAVDGSAVGSLEVSEGSQVLATATKTFAAPLPRTPSGTKRLEPGITAPKPITRVEPIYPDEARQARVSGVCIVEATIDDKGDVTDVRVVKPLPWGLDQAAVEAVKQWKFEPARKDGKPVPVAFNITFNFKPE